MNDPLSPARGIVIGVILGLALWIVSIWIAKAIVAQTVSPVIKGVTCATSPYDVYAVRDGAQVVSC